jgi:putative DNA primase/helicase
MFLLEGTGANGKGVFTRTMQALLGDYARAANISTFFESRRDGSAATPDLARLAGARFIAVSELSEGRRLDEGLIKTLTGQDKIVARFLHGSDFEFSLQGKLVLPMNVRPDIRGTDDGIWRRLVPIPFRVRITEVDRTLEPALQGPELPGILRWAVEGCLAWQREGLQLPDAITVATAEFREEQDLFKAFLADHCELGATESELAGAILARFNASVSRADVMTTRGLAAALRRSGFKVVRNNRGNRWVGLRLKPESHRRDDGIVRRVDDSGDVVQEFAPGRGRELFEERRARHMAAS